MTAAEATKRRRPGRTGAAIVALVSVLAGGIVAAVAYQVAAGSEDAPALGDPDAVAAPVPEPPRPVPAPDEPPTTAPPPVEKATPVRIEIPAIGVDADIIALGLQDDGSLEVPTDYDQTGWYEPGPEPGEVGPAVIAGHVDDHTGPAVFFQLRELRPGAIVRVHHQDSTASTFRVDRLEQYDKNAFPTDDVYGPTQEPTLRLITCGGEFDEAARSYRSNVVAYATAVGSSA